VVGSFAGVEDGTGPGKAGKGGGGRFSLIGVPYGRPALTALAHCIAAGKAGDPLEAVTVLVPTNRAGVSARRWLAGSEGSPMPAGQGLAAVSFLSAARLAERIAATPLARAGRRPVSPAVMASAVRHALATQPGIFAAVREHPTTESELVRAHRELRPLGAGELDRLAATGDRAAEVVRLHGIVSRLWAGSFYDEHDVMVTATGLVRSGASLPVEAAAPLVVHLPQDLTRATASFLGALADMARSAGRGPVAVVAGWCGVAAADSTVALALSLLGLSPPQATPAPPPADKVVSHSDADDEVRWVTRAVLTAIGEGVPVDRIAVLYGRHEPYARLVDEHFAAAGLIRNGSVVRRLSHSVAGRAALGLLALADRDFARDEVMAWLAGAPVRDRSFHLVPAAAWERLSRLAGVVSGDDWDGRLDSLAATLDRYADEADDDPEIGEGRVLGLRRDAGRSRDLRSFVTGLRAEVATGTRQRTWADIASWMRSCLDSYLGPAHRRPPWPEIEEVAADRVLAAVDRLGSLDAMEPDADLARFRRALGVELDAGLGTVGRLGQGVLTGRPVAALGVDLDRVFVLGMVEGEMPPAPQEDSLLPDDERRAVGPALVLRADRPHDEHRALLAAVAGAQHAVFTRPRGDLRRSSQLVASRWVGDAPSVEVPSFVAALTQAPLPATDQEHRVASLLGDRAAAVAIAAVDAPFAAGRELLEARASARFTRFDGNLAGLQGRADPVDRVFSATRLQAYATCPHAYLLEYELGVELVQNPEQVFELSPLDRGSIVHEVLDRWLSDTDGATSITELAEQVFEPFVTSGRVGRSVFWEHARAEILRDLRQFVAQDATWRAEGHDFAVSELAFGLDGGQPAVTLDLGDGRLVRLRGKVDRIDAGPGGALAVLDYKTGGVTAYRSLDRGDPVGRGTMLQLPIYGLAARAWVGDADRPVYAGYWFVSDRGGFRQIGYQLDESRLQRFVGVVGVILDGLAAGHYPQRPPEVAWPWRGRPSYVDHDGLGVRDLQRMWERKRGASELASYVELVEGEAIAHG